MLGPNPELGFKIFQYLNTGPAVLKHMRWLHYQS
jgi:hypothetical protein